VRYGFWPNQILRYFGQICTTILINYGFSLNVHFLGTAHKNVEYGRFRRPGSRSRSLLSRPDTDQTKRSEYCLIRYTAMQILYLYLYLILLTFV
jgi:hypothetical protein